MIYPPEESDSRTKREATVFIAGLFVGLILALMMFGRFG